MSCLASKLRIYRAIDTRILGRIMRFARYTYSRNLRDATLATLGFSFDIKICLNSFNQLRAVERVESSQEQGVVFHVANNGHSTNALAPILASVAWAQDDRRLKLEELPRSISMNWYAEVHQGSTN